MTKEVLISIKGLQLFDDDESREGNEPIEMMLGGEYYLKNGHHYIRYEEMFEGFEEKTQNIVKISENVMEVRKKGVITVHMVFEENKKNISYYTTPFGTMEMGISATQVQMVETDDEILIQVDYALEMNQGYVGDCKLEMKIQSKHIA